MIEASQEVQRVEQEGEQPKELEHTSHKLPEHTPEQIGEQIAAQLVVEQRPEALCEQNSERLSAEKVNEIPEQKLQTEQSAEQKDEPQEQKTDQKLLSSEQKAEQRSAAAKLEDDKGEQIPAILLDNGHWMCAICQRNPESISIKKKVKKRRNELPVGEFESYDSLYHHGLSYHEKMYRFTKKSKAELDTIAENKLHRRERNAKFMRESRRKLKEKKEQEKEKVQSTANLLADLPFLSADNAKLLSTFLHANPSVMNAVTPDAVRAFMRNNPDVANADISKSLVVDAAKKSKRQRIDEALLSTSTTPTAAAVPVNDSDAVDIVNIPAECSIM